ncbi:hypothetical protein B0H10DRAFT_2222353 [Mycena sp. CBHHK59/15]|nr:hypothetical protein B0H10DRAFT_2222353 [Mycena sp. CBHHK59/15]
MPRRKNQSRTKNLGSNAVKRKVTPSPESDDEHPKKRLRDTSPGPESTNDDSDRSDAESIHEDTASSGDFSPELDLDCEEEDAEIEVLEEDDVPHPKDHAALANWLKLSDEHLASLHTTAGAVHCGPYHNRRVGQEISVRRAQEKRKAEKDRQAKEESEDKRHGLKPSRIDGFFMQPVATSSRLSSGPPSPTPEPISPPLPASPDPQPPIEISDEEEPSEIEDFPVELGASSPPDFVGSSSSLVTLKDVDDDEEISIEPLQLSPEVLAEEGLDDLPWDPSEDNSPRPADSGVFIERVQTPNQSVSPQNTLPTSSLPPGSAAYFDHPQGFTLPNRPRRWKMPTQVPSNASVDAAIDNLQKTLHPQRKVGRGHQKTNLDMVTTARLECMIRFLRLYKAAGYAGWTLHSGTVAVASRKSGLKTWLGRKIHQWTINFCEDSKNLPNHMYGRFNSSIMADEDIAGDIHLHLQSLSKWVSAKDIVRYVATPEFQARLSVKRKIKLCTAQRWMHKMGYRWRKEPRGMYSDGHEREDVVNYRQNIFLPRWRELEARSRWWEDSTQTDEIIDFQAQMGVYMSRPGLDARVVVIWRHDESTFYANDRRELRWVHNTEKAAIKPKGEGASQMVGDFVSDVYGWMRSKKPNANGYDHQYD